MTSKTGSKLEWNPCYVPKQISRIDDDAPLIFQDALTPNRPCPIQIGDGRR